MEERDTTSLKILMKSSLIFLTLRLVKETNITYLSKRSGLVFPVVHKLIRKAKMLGLVDIKPVGRERIVTLTEKGERLAEYIEGILKILPNSILKND